MRTEKRTPDGREIIAREPALTPHPHPTQDGRLVPTAGISKVLLDDGSEQTECDHCGKLFDSANSARSHLVSHRENAGAPLYPVETIRRVLREIALAKRNGRGFHGEAAERLNDAGVATFGGQPWTASSVASLYRHWHTKIKIRVPGGRETRPVSAPPTTSRQTSSNGVNADIAGQVARIKLALDQVCGQLGDLGEAIARVGQAITALPAVDAQAVEDARRFRELQRLMGGGS